MDHLGSIGHATHCMLCSFASAPKAGSTHQPPHPRNDNALARCQQGFTTWPHCRWAKKGRAPNQPPACLAHCHAAMNPHSLVPAPNCKWVLGTRPLSATCHTSFVDPLSMMCHTVARTKSVPAGLSPSTATALSSLKQAVPVKHPCQWAAKHLEPPTRVHFLPPSTVLGQQPQMMRTQPSPCNWMMMNCFWILKTPSLLSSCTLPLKTQKIL